MLNRTRRELFADIGRGMIAASVGTAFAHDLGFATAFAADEQPARLTFGDLDPLVNFLQETPPDKLVSAVITKLKGGTELKQLVAAAALTNARAFGGEDYIGFHTLMALAPAFQMSQEETKAELKPLAVLKVLHRNASRLKDFGPTKETLKTVAPGKLATTRGGEQLREVTRKGDLAAAEATFAAICANGKPEDALNELMVEVDDATEVHRVVLVSRAWDLTRFVGTERASTMLRQSVHYCVNIEKNASQIKYNGPIREQLPKLLDQYKLVGSKPGTKAADDAWVVQFADTVFKSDAAQAADAVASALSEGFSADAIGEALSLAANQLVLRDEGRPKAWVSPGKPEGSIHGDSIGVHACDTIHAWRNLASIGDRRTQVTSLILAGYQIGRDRANRAEFLKWDAYPRTEHSDKVKGLPADSLLKELDGAIRDKDQARAAALTARLSETSNSAKDVFNLFRTYAISEDGALHAEKYYATASDEFARARAAFKWRQLIALARVTASAYGYAAPAHKEACERLKA
ncbi:hypothetical protein J8F10_09705 [Gemmata sp. G18]|uniref:Uncharacterized protein n=1 Tax=Gemmata palustris TaxID=2822762 RepID=A0ABS5BPA1_9BACT|nr:hypothetical protein [Gemmata palustris]MBP3955555.1 hypothetical protein [Gemmata palustris]